MPNRPNLGRLCPPYKSRTAGGTPAVPAPALRHSLLEEAEIVDIRGPVCVRPRRAVTPKARERVAADLLLVDHADIGTRRDFRLDLFFLDRCAGMRSAVRKRYALAPLGPDALLSEHARTRHQRRQNHQASHSFPPVQQHKFPGSLHPPETYSTPFARKAAFAAGLARNFTKAAAPSRLAGAAEGAAA